MAADFVDRRPTHRALEIIQLCAAGLTQEEVGERLYISPRTVKWYLAELHELLGARNTTHAVVLCIAAGYLHIDRDVDNPDRSTALGPPVAVAGDLVAA